MKRRIAVLVFAGVLLVGHSAPAFALNRSKESSDRPFRQLVIKAVKQLKSVLRIAPAEDMPIPPRPCTPGTPGCP